MDHSRWTRRLVPAVLWGAASASVLAPVCAAEPVSARMEMYGPAGVQVLTLFTRLDETANGYSVAVDYATAGIAKVFVDIRTHAEAQGRLTPSGTNPVAFRSESKRNGV